MNDVHQGYIDAAISNEAAVVANAQVSSRNHVLNRSAFKLGSIPGTQLETVDGALFPAARANGYMAEHGEQATRKVIESGFQSGQRKQREVPRPNRAERRRMASESKRAVNGSRSPAAVSPLLDADLAQLRQIGCDVKAAVGTIKIILVPVNRRGRSSASLPDGMVLVGSSRQPFLDAARVLIAAGYDPDSWLEGWRPGATAFALRARLGIAAGLTVDETKTVFAKWKPFSSSAVASSIDHSEIPATTLAAAPSTLLRAPLEQPSEISSSAEQRCAGPSSASADELGDRARSSSRLADDSSRSTRA